MRAFLAWLAMDGFGPYVWGAYGFTIGGVVCTAILVWRTLQKERRAFDRLNQSLPAKAP